MKNQPIAIPRRVFLVALFLFVAAGGITVAQGPRIRWSVEDISETIAAGSVRTVTLGLQTGSDLPEVSLWLSPSIRDLATVKPASLSSLPANQDQELVLTFRIPIGMKLGEEGGTLHVKQGEKTVPVPLNINLLITAKGN